MNPISFLLFIITYLLIGWVSWISIYDTGDIKNPIWGLPFAIFWPLVWAYAFIIMIVSFIKIWVEETKEYYKKEKREKQK